MKDEYFDIRGIKIPRKYLTYLVWFGLAFFLAWAIIPTFAGYKEIGKFFEKRNYTTQYWIYLQPENADVKNYRVKADIERIIHSYYLKRVYWTDGGYSDFDDCELSRSDEGMTFVPNETYCIPDGKDTGYNIRLEGKVK